MKRSLEDLPTYRQKVGTEEKSKTIHLFGGLTEKKADTVGRALNKAVKNSAWFESRNGNRGSMPSSIEPNSSLKEPLALKRKSRVK
ncbi:hypothetical protein [Herbaspirillum huttiense]|uniref:hypothetical protein n=1 Tax=Herbaspirillum huttiense TaxID=863372 RepID=UPI0031DE5DF5